MSILSAKYRYAGELGEAAKFFRQIAFEIEASPDNILNYQDSIASQLLLSDDSSDCVKKVELYEALAYGDAGCLFASPRPCLSGLLLHEIGTIEQKHTFHEYIKKHHARTCFAVTEPKHGSDAAKIETAITLDTCKQSYFLNGKKWLFGNGTCAKIGVVLARNHNGPLGIQPVLARLEEYQTAENISRELLPMIGLKAAQLSKVTFTNFPVDNTDILGLHLNPMKRGLLALVKTFNKMRLCIAALAIGHTFAIIDYICEHRQKLTQKEISKLEHYEIQAQSLKAQIQKTAITLNQNPEQTSLVAHVKALATQLVECVTSNAFDFFGAGSFIEHPYLAKSYRDAFAYEYADGTTHIQHHNIYHSYNNGTFNPNI